MEIEILEKNGETMVRTNSEYEINFEEYSFQCKYID